MQIYYIVYQVVLFLFAAMVANFIDFACDACELKKNLYVCNINEHLFSHLRKSFEKLETFKKVAKQLKKYKPVLEPSATAMSQLFNEIRSTSSKNGPMLLEIYGILQNDSMGLDTIDNVVLPATVNTSFRIGGPLTPNLEEMVRNVDVWGSFAPMNTLAADPVTLDSMLMENGGSAKKMCFDRVADTSVPTNNSIHFSDIGQSKNKLDTERQLFQDYVARKEVLFQERDSIFTSFCSSRMQDFSARESFLDQRERQLQMGEANLLVNKNTFAVLQQQHFAKELETTFGTVIHNFSNIFDSYSQIKG